MCTAPVGALFMACRASARGHGRAPERGGVARELLRVNGAVREHHAKAALDRQRPAPQGARTPQLRRERTERSKILEIKCKRLQATVRILKRLGAFPEWEVRPRLNSKSRKSVNLEMDRPDFGGRKPRGEGLAKKEGSAASLLESGLDCCAGARETMRP